MFLISASHMNNLPCGTSLKEKFQAMRMKVGFLSLLIIAAGFVPAVAVAQQDDDVRGAFITTRPKATSKSSSSKSTATTKPSHRRPKTTGTTTAGTDASTGSTTTPAKINVPRIGLGLTLFMRDSNGLAVRTDPSHEFTKGDHVRFLIETNADGYLYLFNTTAADVDKWSLSDRAS